MRITLPILSILALSLGCQRPEAPATAGSTNLSEQQFQQLFAQETSKANAWFAALDAARPSAPLVLEFLRLFPAATVNYRYFTPTGEPGFDLSVELHERYELWMQLPVNFDLNGGKVIGYGEPQFTLLEAASQSLRERSYNPAGARGFGSAEWERIVANNGDFSAIGYIMITNQPVPGFNNRRVDP